MVRRIFFKRTSPVAAMLGVLFDAHLNYKKKRQYEELDEAQRRTNHYLKASHLDALKKLDILVLGILNQSQGAVRMQNIVDTLWAHHKKSFKGDASASTSTGINPDKNGGGDRNHDHRHHGD